LFLPIYLARDCSDPFQSLFAQMPTRSLEHVSKQQEVLLLGRSKWILLKEGNDLLAEIFHRPHAVPIEVLSMVVVPAIDKDAAAAEETLQEFENRSALGALSYDELRKHLTAKLYDRASLDCDREAAFSIDESHDPTDCFQSFLLMICIHHIVTALDPGRTHGE
jgi:hypothetical protein